MAVQSHLARARWMIEVGYRYLAASQYPGAERESAEQFDFLRLLGIQILPPDGHTKH